ncbi:MAG: alpha/beta hydrolase [Bacteroidia bacterium]
MDVRHYVASNRLIDPVKVSGQPDQYWYRFDGNSDADKATVFMRCGRYVDNNGRIAAPSFFSGGDEDKDYDLSSFSSAVLKAKASSAELFSTLFAELEKERKDLLIYNFGYENRKSREYEQLKDLHEKYILPQSSPLGRILMITWPSQGFGEYDDEIGKDNFFKRTFYKLISTKLPERTPEQINNDVKVTGDALAVFLLKLSDFVKGRYTTAASGIYKPRINFIAQSMANAIFIRCMNRLQELGMQNEVGGLFSRLMLTAPDIPDNVFETEPAYSEGMKIAEKVYVVCSGQDNILKASDVFHNIAGTKRLGISGPRDLSKVPSNVFKMDIHQSRISFIPKDYNHRYFVYNQEVVNRYLEAFNGRDAEKKEIV